MFDWKDEYAVNIGSIDTQHRGLFAIAAEMHTAMSAGQGRAALGKILDRLIQYTASHFAHEERLMRLYDYPNLEAHQAEHKALTRKVLDFQKEFQNGRATMSVQVLIFLKDWLSHHIQDSDQRYAPYLTRALVV